jgi:FkbM family methyltransferase
VVDGGAGYGTFTLLASKLVGSEGRVVAVEPVPSSVVALEGTVRGSRLSNVTVVPAALSAQEGRLTMTLRKGRYAEATGCRERAPIGDDVECVEVSQKTIDGLVVDLALPRVDFIKLNIEGMEAQALTGAAETIRKWRPRLSVSVAHLRDDAARLTALVKNLDASYVTTISKPSGGLPILLAAAEGIWGAGERPVMVRRT